jgi:hypothetical protein
MIDLSGGHYANDVKYPKVSTFSSLANSTILYDFDAYGDVVLSNATKATAADVYGNTTATTITYTSEGTAYYNLGANAIEAGHVFHVVVDLQKGASDSLDYIDIKLGGNDSNYATKRIALNSVWQTVSFKYTLGANGTEAFPALFFSSVDRDASHNKVMISNPRIIQGASINNPFTNCFENSYTFSATSCSAGASVTQDFTLTGGILGDYAAVAPATFYAGLMVTAQVTTTNTVRVTYFNPTASTVSITNHTVYIRATRPKHL